MELTQLAQQSSPPVKEAEGYSSVVALAEEHFEEGLVSCDLHVQDNLRGPDLDFGDTSLQLIVGPIIVIIVK